MTRLREVRPRHDSGYRLTKNVVCLFLLGLVLVCMVAWQRWRKLQSSFEKVRAERQALAEQASASHEELPLISILIPAWNEAANLGSMLRALNHFKYPRVETIVCAGGDDDTQSIAEEWSSNFIFVIPQEKGDGKQVALRKCYERSSGDIIVLVDADCSPESERLMRLLNPLLNKSASIVTGDYEPLDSQRSKPFVVYQWAIRKAAWLSKPEYLDGLIGGNAALTRKALDDAGGFAEQIHTGTDTDLAFKLLRHGYKIKRIDYAEMPTRFPEEFGTYWKQQSRWGRNLFIHSIRHGQFRSLAPACIQFAMASLTLFGPFLALPLGPVGIVAWLLLLTHGIFTKAVYVRTLKTLRYDTSVLSPLHLALFTVVDCVAWIRVVIDLVSKSRRASW